MSAQSFGIGSFPRAILHIDGDAFFASCEQALHPELKGKPVVTGKERGIASAASYEAKARGVKRAMRLSEVLAVCPDAIILPSDYETYSLFSKRMYTIVRRYTSAVEEYSIDECFADISGMRRPFHMSYPAIAKKIKHDLESELNMTFSVGLGPTKVIAKLASKWNKPSGLTMIPLRDIHIFLGKLPVEKVWGVGPQTTAYLAKFGIKTALDFALRSETWVTGHLTKPHYEIWQELRGEFVYELNTDEKDDYQSISKTKTFTPPSSNKAFVLAQLSKNIENACIKARRHHLAAKEIALFLKTQEFRYHGLAVELSRSTAAPNEILAVVEKNFDRVFRRNTLYRATGIVLTKLSELAIKQMDLFGETLVSEKAHHAFESVDELARRYGKHAVFLATSFYAQTGKQHRNERSDTPLRRKDQFKGETKRKRIGLPVLGEVR